MPQIKPYEPGPLELRPSEIGVEATAAAARRLGAFSNQVAGATAEVGRRAGSEIGSAIQSVGTEAVNQITAHQVSHGAATFATISDDITNQWNETVKNADPNDPAVAAKFREKVLEPKLQEWNTGFNTEAGQKWAEAHVEHLRSHMFEKTSADMMTLAKQAASNNAHQTLNQLSNTVYNDPSGLKFALDTFGSSLNGIVDSSPNLKGTAAAEVKTALTEKGREQIIKQAAIGYIVKTGQIPDFVNDPAYSKYINGAELETFRKNAVAQQKASLYYERAAARDQKLEADLAVHKGINDVFNNSVSVDPNDPNKVRIAPNAMQQVLDVVRKNPDAPSAATAARTAIDWLEHQQRVRAEPVIDNPTVKADFIGRLSDANTPLTKMEIYAAEAKGDLTTRTGGIYRQMVDEMGPGLLKDPLVHAALDGVRERVGFTSVYDGHERFSQAMQAFYPEYVRQKAAGTLKPNALDLKDETSLIRQAIKTYEPPPAERMQMHILKTIGAGAGVGGLGGDTAAVAPTAFVPPSNWQWNPARRQYRDPDGKLYDAGGRAVKPAAPQSR